MTFETTNELDWGVTLVDVAANVPLQVAVVLQAAQCTKAGQAWMMENGQPMCSLLNILKVTEDKVEIERAVCIVADALLDRDGQFRHVRHLDRDMLRLALDCLVDRIEATSSHGVYEHQPWRFFLARIGVNQTSAAAAQSCGNANGLPAAIAARVDLATESKSAYISYLHKEIDEEWGKSDLDINRIEAMEREIEILQNINPPSFRRWRQG